MSLKERTDAIKIIEESLDYSQNSPNASNKHKAIHIFNMLHAANYIDNNRVSFDIKEVFEEHMKKCKGCQETGEDCEGCK